MSDHDSLPVLISADPWPKAGISSYSHVQSGSWGVMEFYSDGSYNFNEDAKPSTEEIVQRWGMTLLRNAENGIQTCKKYQLNIPVTPLFNGKWFIGCQISEAEAVIEGTERWETKHQAVMAILENTWTRSSEIETTPFANAAE